MAAFFNTLLYQNGYFPLPTSPIPFSPYADSWKSCNFCVFVTGLTQLSHRLYSPLEVFQNHHVFMQLHPLYLSFFSLLNFHFIHEGYTRPNMEFPLPVKNVFPLLVFFLFNFNFCSSFFVPTTSLRLERESTLIPICTQKLPDKMWHTV